jgi:hypothetical protein
MTSGVAALPADTVWQIVHLVRTFSAFGPDNDPHHEHDFGRIVLTDGTRVYWKFDYYANQEMKAGAEDPSDPTRSFRQLAILLAEEY